MLLTLDSISENVNYPFGSSADNLNNPCIFAGEQDMDLFGDDPGDEDLFGMESIDDLFGEDELADDLFGEEDPADNLFDAASTEDMPDDENTDDFNGDEKISGDVFSGSGPIFVYQPFRTGTYTLDCGIAESVGAFIRLIENNRRPEIVAFIIKEILLKEPGLSMEFSKNMILADMLSFFQKTKIFSVILL